MFFQPSDIQKIVDFLNSNRAEAITMHAQGLKSKAAIKLYNSVMDSGMMLHRAGISFKQQALGNMDCCIKEAQKESQELVTTWMEGLSFSEKDEFNHNVSVKLANPEPGSLYATLYMQGQRFGASQDINDYDENLMPINGVNDCTIS